MRTKEDAHDYRYFPDPDLPPLRLTQARIDAVRATMPELPDVKKARLMADFGLSSYDASVIVEEQETAAYYEQAVAASKAKEHTQAAKMIANWLMGEVFAALNRESKTIQTMSLLAPHLGELIDLILDDTISGKIAKDVFSKMWDSGKAPALLVDELGLRQISDTGAIEKAIDELLARDAAKAAEYRSGKEQLFGYFVGQIMKAMHGKANPGVVNELLKKKLG